VKLAEMNKTYKNMAWTHFMNLEGAELEYYGADSGDCTFKIDNIVFKVVEDADDGYRSYLGTIDYTDLHNSIFFKTPIASVKIEIYDTANNEKPERDDDDQWMIGGVNQGYRLIDVNDGHVWLEFGTQNYDDYYPMFIFRHTPKEVKE